MTVPEHGVKKILEFVSRRSLENLELSATDALDCSKQGLVGNFCF